jgi:hypothetical protein
MTIIDFTGDAELVDFWSERVAFAEFNRSSRRR